MSCPSWTETEPARSEVLPVDDSTAAQMAAMYKVLSDPTRVRIVSMLLAGELCVHELAEALEMTQSAISHQLAMLREMRLVTTQKVGRHVIYRLDDDHIEDLFAQGLAHVQHS